MAWAVDQDRVTAPERRPEDLAMMNGRVRDLLDACPFLAGRVDQDNLTLPTVIFGEVARLLIDHRLPLEQEDLVFRHFNALAESGASDIRDILGTGAIELFNDDAGSQRLARTKLKGPALEMLEDFRRSWGQPDYGGAQ